MNILHYKNMPIQSTDYSEDVKIKSKSVMIFFLFLLKTLILWAYNGSYEYPQFMFGSKIRIGVPM